MLDYSEQQDMQHNSTGKQVVAGLGLTSAFLTA